MGPAGEGGGPTLGEHSAFTILQEKHVSVSRVALCHKMDLIAIVTNDGSLAILRTIAWQRLHSVPVAELQNNRITAVTWSPDGNVVALGHQDGTVSLLDIETGDQPVQQVARKPEDGQESQVRSLTWATQFKDPQRLSPDDLEKDESDRAARYYQERDGRFLEDLPALGQQAGSTFARSKEKKADTVGAKLTSSSGLDALIACHDDGTLVVLISGVLPLLTLRMPSLLGIDSSPLRILSACPTLDFSALMVAVEHGASTHMAVVDTGILWAARHEIRALAREASHISSLLDHIKEAMDQADKQWRDGIRVLEIKLKMLKDLLANYGCTATMREAFLGLLATGVPTSALAQYIESSSTEGQQQNMFRLSKAVDDKCANIEGLLRDQVGRVAEMVLFRASKLRGMALCGDEWEALGVNPAGVTSLIEAAARLSIKAEEALCEVQEGRQNLKVFLLWLLDTMQHMASPHAEPPKDKRSFRMSVKHTRMLLAFLRKPAGPKHLSNTEEIIATQVSAYFQNEPLPVPFQSEPDVEPELATVSLRQQAEALKRCFEATVADPISHLNRQPRRLDVVCLSSSPTLSPALLPRPSGAVLVAVPQRETLSLLQLDVSQRPPTATRLVSFSLQQTCQLQHACFYSYPAGLPLTNDEAVVILARVEDYDTSSEIAKLPLDVLLDAEAEVAVPVSASHGLIDGAVVHSLGDIEGPKSRRIRHTGAAAAFRLDVTGARGVACMHSDASQVVLLDMEEDEEEGEEEGDVALSEEMEVEGAETGA